VREVQGDLWKVLADAKVITTNGSLKKDGSNVMGRGVALQAARRWPELPSTLGSSLVSAGNHICSLGSFSFDPGAEQHYPTAYGLPTKDTFELVAYPVKEEWSQPARLDLVRRSAVELVSLTDFKGWQTVAMPRPGCGNGGLEWNQVKAVISPLLDKRFLVIQW
jgi:O-acetyl-ADP-ribose deacetylase (regulator of RNase III)